MKKFLFCSCAWAVVCFGFLASAGAENTPQLREEFSDSFYGFQIKGPSGWVKETVPTKKEIVRFRKNPSLQKELFFPDLSISIDIAPASIKNSVDFSREVINWWKKKLAQAGTSSIKVVEEPHEVQINGIKASRAIFDLTSKSGKTTRNVDYKFMKDGRVFSVQGFDWAESGNKHLKEFEEAAQSFKFI